MAGQRKQSPIISMETRYGGKKIERQAPQNGCKLCQRRRRKVYIAQSERQKREVCRRNQARCALYE